MTAYEQTNEIGGTWVYRDDIGKDKYGLDIHSSMYKGLHTNLPKEIMHYPDFPFPEQEISYLSAEEVLKYYQSYADSFNLKKYIKFEHHVVRVRPLLNETWEVIVKDLKSNEYETVNYDAVLVCNGHYNAPFIPDYEGRNVFAGKQIHSHDYRCCEPFTNESVLIIGAGPSGRDAVLDIQHVAENVTWSHHWENGTLISNLRENVTQKPDALKFTEDGVIFIDGSYQKFSVILYCTGYQYTFPFLSIDCGLSVDDNCVEPLYKHCININRPTLAIIGLPNFVCPNQMFDIQARFCLTFISGRQQFPSKEAMLEDLENDRRIQYDERKLSKKKFHFLGVGYLEGYYDSLSKIANIDPIEPVIPMMFEKGLSNLNNNFLEFRKEVFKVIDNKTFITITK